MNQKLRIAIFTLLTCVGANLSAVDAAAEKTPKGAELTFGDTLGVCTKFDQGEPMAHLDLLTDLGVKWARDVADWDAIELKPRQYVFPEKLSKRLQFYKDHDIGVVFGLWYSNGKAYPKDGLNPEHFGRYAAAVAKMLEARGLRYVLEIWNEPGNFVIKDLGGSRNGSPPSPWLDHYLKMVHAAVKAVKAEVPNAKLIMGDDVVPVHYWMMRAGVPKALDGVTIHPYIHRPTAGPEVRQVDSPTWSTPFVTMDEDRSNASMIRRLSDGYTEALGRKPEIWATEIGYGIGRKNYSGGPVTEEIAAAFLTRTYVYLAGAGVRATLWFSLQDAVDIGQWGLVDNADRKRLPYYALKTLSAQLGKTKLVRQISGQDHPTTGVQAYLFEGSMGHQVVAWNIDGPSTVGIETGTSFPLRVVSNLGAPVKVFDMNGQMGVELGISPVFISGVGDDVVLHLAPAK